MSKNIGIPEVLESLREALDEAQDALLKSDKEALLSLDAAEIELSVSISQASSAGGKVGFNVLGIGVGAEAKETLGEQSTHKIKLSLKPIRNTKVALAGKSTKRKE